MAITRPAVTSEEHHPTTCNYTGTSTRDVFWKLAVFWYGLPSLGVILAGVITSVLILDDYNSYLDKGGSFAIAIMNGTIDATVSGLLLWLMLRLCRGAISRCPAVPKRVIVGAGVLLGCGISLPSILSILVYGNTVTIGGGRQVLAIEGVARTLVSFIVPATLMVVILAPKWRRRSI